MEKIQEKRIFEAILIKKNEMKEFLSLHKNSILNEERIPSIIHPDKEYDAFEVNNIDTFDSDSVIVLLKSNSLNDKGIFNLEMTFNCKFFTHTELIRKLTNDEIQFSAYEIIGDIIHLNLTEEQQKYKQIIADVIFFKTGKTVINKTGKIEETFRFYHSEILAGPKTLTTIHRENNVNFYLDLGNVYWCSRLQSERIRILGMIKKGDVISDPFCGVGPHIVPAIKKGAKAFANDLNPKAIECLEETLKINKLHCECIQNEDAGVFLKQMASNKIDHVIFNLPEHSLDFIKYLEDYKLDFWMHIFFFCKDDVDCVDMIYERTGYKVKKEWLRKVRKVSPSKWVYKLEIKACEFFKNQKHD